jgi:hypothetical protein
VLGAPWHALVFPWGQVLRDRFFNGTCYSGLRALLESNPSAGVGDDGGAGIPKFLRKPLCPAGELTKFMENYAIILLLEGISLKNRNFVGFFRGKEVPETVLGQKKPKLSHNVLILNFLVSSSKESQRDCFGRQGRCRLRLKTKNYKNHH